MNKIIKDGKILHYIIDEKLNKHTYFKPRDGYLLIIKAKKMPLKKVENHINNNFLKYYELTKPIDELSLKLWGKKHQLEIIKSSNFSYQITQDKIIVYNDNKSIKQLKIIILTTELKKYLLENRANYLNVLNQNNIKEVPIVLKYLTSKFGSYHYLTNKIVLNVFLATLDKNFTDYVVYHEYAHQIEKNHQKGFYNLLEKMYKDYRIYNSKLKNIMVKI